MVVTAGDILECLSQWAPLETAESWDNVGFQIGEPKQPVKTIAIALEIDAPALVRLTTAPVDLVITHHPVIFRPISRVDTTSDIGKILTCCLKNNITVMSLHTNLDMAYDGVTDCLMTALGYSPIHAQGMTPHGLGRWLTLPTPQPCLSLPENTVWVGGAQKKSYQTLGFCGGNGRSLLKKACALELDAFITGEIGYHDAVWCQFQQLPVALLGHKESEMAILPKIKSTLLTAFPDLSIDCYP